MVYPASVNFPTTFFLPSKSTSQIETEIASMERNARISKIVKIIFYVLGALFTAASVVAGFLMPELLRISVPLAVASFAVAITFSQPRNVIFEKSLLPDLLKTTDHALIERGAKSYRNIELASFNYDLKLTDVKKWILEKVRGDFKSRLDSSLPISHPDDVIPLTRLKSLIREYDSFARTSERYNAENDPNTRDLIFKMSVNDKMLNSWQLASRLSPDDELLRENIRHFIASTKGIETAFLGHSFSPEIVVACSAADVNHIVLDNGMPMFSDAAHEILTTKKIKKIKFNYSLASVETQSIFEQFFKLENPEDRKYLDYHSTWVRK